MQRFAQLISLKPESIADYERLHANAWAEVLATIDACNIHNYSIFRHGTTLFAYFEYRGEDFAADIATMAADPKTQEWWAICRPMQVPLPGASPDDWWTTIPEVFHTD